MKLAERIDGPRTLAERAESAIRDAILDGDMPPGARLTIDELARAFGLSPMPVRDALRKLASTGFVEYLPHRGATVALLSIDDLRDTWDARLALETVAIRRAATQFTEADRRVVEAAIERHTATLVHNDHAAARSAHRDIHMGFYNPSGYNWLDRLVEPVWIRSERYRSVALSDRGGPEGLAAEHRRILDACAAGDPDAATKALYEHLVRTANILAERLVGAPLFDPTPPSSLGQVTNSAETGVSRPFAGMHLREVSVEERL